jgi:hypothetical protein
MHLQKCCPSAAGKAVKKALSLTGVWIQIVPFIRTRGLVRKTIITEADLCSGTATVNLLYLLFHQPANANTSPAPAQP